MFDATPLLKLYARHRYSFFSRSNPAQIQQRQLLSLITRAAQTKFGKDHHFASIKSVEQYQKQVPLRTYEQFWNEYWRAPFPTLVDCTWPGKVPFFAVSSGTSSGVTKYIPFTPAMQRSNTKAGLDLLSHHVINKPDSRIFGGKSFMLGGSTELVEQAPGIFSGDLSGIAVKTLPWWARARYFPDQRLALLKDWEEKIAILSERALKDDIRMISGVPSWMLIFLDRIFEREPQAQRQIRKAFPRLDMLVHGGVSFAPYHSQFMSMLAEGGVDLREVYPASEGFIAIGDRSYGEGLRLNLDHQIFFEFVPLEEFSSSSPTRHWIGNVERDVNYAIVLTTCAGLWSYVIGDTVRFVDTETPRVLVTGRTSYYLSAFGEHLIAEEIDDGIMSASREIGKNVTDYSVGPIFPAQAGELGGHLYIIEFADGLPSPEQKEAFTRTLDARLCKRNEDYEAHRAQGFGLNAPTILPVAPGTFKAWMTRRGKLGGQNKVPRIITNLDLLKDLESFARESQHGSL